MFGLLILATLGLSVFIAFGGLTISPWRVCLSPGVLLLALPALRTLSQPYGLWLYGGWTNIVFVLHYASLLLLGV